VRATQRSATLAQRLLAAALRHQTSRCARRQQRNDEQCGGRNRRRRRRMRITSAWRHNALTRAAALARQRCARFFSFIMLRWHMRAHQHRLSTSPGITSAALRVIEITSAKSEINIGGNWRRRKTRRSAKNKAKKSIKSAKIWRRKSVITQRS